MSQTPRPSSREALVAFLEERFKREKLPKDLAQLNRRLVKQLNGG